MRYVIALALIASACTASATPSSVPASPSAASCTFTVGDPATLVTKAKRDEKDLPYWPDLSFGVLKQGPTYTFFTGNYGVTARTIGTLDDPLATAVMPRVVIGGQRGPHDYYAGTTIYRDPATGALVQLTYSERLTGAKAPGTPVGGGVYTDLGLARSTDEGKTWTDLGPIMTPERQFDPSSSAIVNLGYALTIVGDYFMLYFRDTQPSGARTPLAAARARVDDVFREAAAGRAAAWTKYYNGGWTEPALGGRSTDLPHRNGFGEIEGVSFNTRLNRYLMLVQTQPYIPRNFSLEIIQSADGFDWSSADPVTIVQPDGDNFNAMIVGLGDDPTRSDDRFYVFYANSHAQDDSVPRWSDSVLMRRLVSCG
jgi:hypothetical protein